MCVCVCLAKLNMLNTAQIFNMNNLCTLIM